MCGMLSRYDPDLAGIMIIGCYINPLVGKTTLNINKKA